MEYNYLYHHGAKGMKWGVRRYQNKDGSLTPAGKKRYSSGLSKRKSEDDYHADYKKAHDKKSVKNMSDQELRERNTRLQMEQQYASLTKKKNRGEKAVKAYIATAGTIAGVVAATATYKKYVDQGIDKIGDAVVKGIKFGNLTN